MKEYLERKLPASLWGSVRRGWHFILKTRDGFVAALAGFLIVILGFPSQRLLAAIKERLTIIVRMDYSPRNIYLNADSIIEYQTRRNSCKKEPETVHWIESQFKPGDVFYDIGANVGAYSFVAARQSEGKIKVYAFEPSYSTFAQLNKNIILNSCEGKIIPFCVALSSRTEISFLNYSSLAPGAALHSLTQTSIDQERALKPVTSQPVLSYRIDDLITTFEIEKPTYIKLDVDGTELEILKGADETLRHPGLKSILIEVETGLETSARITDFLGERGFHVQMKRRHDTSGTAPSNYVFVRG